MTQITIYLLIFWLTPLVIFLIILCVLPMDRNTTRKDMLMVLRNLLIPFTNYLNLLAGLWDLIKQYTPIEKWLDKPLRKHKS